MVRSASMRNKLAPTADELVVHEKIFGGCCHRNWRQFSTGDRTAFQQQVLVCSDCNEEFGFRKPDSFGTEMPDESPSDFLLLDIPHYSRINELRFATIRAVEASGWSVMFHEVGGLSACSISGAEGTFKSLSFPTRTAAVCAAAAQLGRSGRFVRAD